MLKLHLLNVFRSLTTFEPLKSFLGILCHLRVYNGNTMFCTANIQMNLFDRGSEIFIFVVSISQFPSPLFLTSRYTVFVSLMVLRVCLTVSCTNRD